MSLYRQNGGVPAELPFLAVEEAAQRVWTDLANNPNGMTACGFVEAPAQPAFDPATHTVRWDDASEAWVVEAIPAPTLGEQQAAKATTVSAKLSAILSAGAPASGLHVALDDGSRADMSAMATTALAASAGITWPDSYKLGWIAIENTRIPLPTPAAGLGLAASVGDFYAKARQRARDLKDAISAAAGQAALDSVDVEAGWPV